MRVLPLTALVLATGAVAFEVPEGNIVPDTGGGIFSHQYGHGAVFSADDAGVDAATFSVRKDGDAANSKSIVEAFISPFIPANAAGDFYVTGEYETAHNGYTHIYTQQWINGMAVLNGVGHFNLDRSKNVVSTFDHFWKGDVAAVPAASSDVLTPNDAVQALINRFGGTDGADPVFSNTPADGAEKMYVINGKQLSLAWIFQAEVGGFEHVLSVAVDAVSGKVLQSIDLVADTEAHLDDAEHHHSHAHDPENETQNPARSRELKRKDKHTKVRIPAELHCTDECLVGDPNSSMSSVKDIKVAHWASAKLAGRMPHNYPSVVNQPKISCTNGEVVAGGNTYACDNVDMYSFLSISDLSTGITGSFQYVGDNWGWQHQDGREFTIQCMNNAVVFIDSTDPTSPVHVATMMSVNEASSYWCDVKVHKDTAYVVKDSASQQGIQVFDLNRLVTEGSYSGNPPNLGADFNYNEHGSSHNLAVNTETEYLYSIGTSTCSGGLHMIDVSSPLNPTFVGCAGSDGYIHDTQCVTYTGPDTRYTSRELCFGFNEDTLTIYDVTDKSSPVIVFRGGYEGSGYTHQGWLNAEMTSLLLNDELDETNGNTDNSRTRTYVWDITTLDAAFPSGHFDHPEQSIDHNLYMWGPIHKNGWGGSPPMANPPLDQFSYLSNYCSGLRIVDLSQQENGVLHQAGYFDTDPACDTDDFEGAWSNYMHPSGTIAVANIGSGVFFLDFAYTFTGLPPTASPTRQPTPEEGDGEGTYRGWGIPNLDPSKGDSELHVNPSQKGGANTLGWHATSLSQEYEDTRGNNVFAQENSANSDDFPPPFGYRPKSQSITELLFDFPMDFDTDPATGTNLDATVTNLFYMNNIMHDVLYTYGFDEVSGNFQENNLGRGGNGGDAVVANAMDGSGSNNANMYTPSDGSAPRMRMYRWDYVGNIDRPSSLDGMVVAHEYGHGLSNRLTGGPGASGCLGSSESGGMGEGWSDYLGVIMSMNLAEDYEKAHGVGGWLVGGIGIRAYPYSLDMTVNPMTFADVNDQGGSVHGIGTVWCTILFDMSADLVAAHGYSSDIYQNGNPGGNNIAFANVVDGMKLQPCNPNFIQARDAILLADQANYDGVHQCTMWRSFARRGLGTMASFTNTASESFCIPEECGGEYCVETPSPTMPAYPDQDLGVLGMGSTTSLEGSTASRSDTYGNPAPDVRVAFAVPDSLPASTTITISLCSSFSNYDTYLWLLDSNGNQLASNDDSCDLLSRIHSTASQGSSYTIVVDGYESNSGDFGLTVTVGDAPEFPTPTVSPTSRSDEICRAAWTLWEEYGESCGASVPTAMPTIQPPSDISRICAGIWELEQEHECGIPIQSSPTPAPPTHPPTPAPPTIAPTPLPTVLPTPPTIAPTAMPTEDPANLKIFLHTTEHHKSGSASHIAMTLYDVLGNDILDADLGTSITETDQAYEFTVFTTLDREVTSAEGYQRMNEIRICVQESFNDDIRLRPEIELVLWGVHYDISEFDKSMVRIKGNNCRKYMLTRVLDTNTCTCELTSCDSTDLVQGLYFYDNDSVGTWFDATIDTWDATTITLNWDDGDSTQRVQPYGRVRQRSTQLACTSIQMAN